MAGQVFGGCCQWVLDTACQAGEWPSATAVRLCRPQHCPLTKIILTSILRQATMKVLGRPCTYSLELQKPRSDDPGLLLCSPHFFHGLTCFPNPLIIAIRWTFTKRSSSFAPRNRTPTKKLRNWKKKTKTFHHRGTEKTKGF